MTRSDSPRETTVRAALRGGSWALVGTFAGRVANVGVLLLAARALGGEQFGAMSLALSTALVVTSVTTLGLPVAAQKLVAEAGGADDPRRREELISTTLKLLGLLGLVTVSGFLLLAPAIAEYVLADPALTPLLLVAGLLVFTTPCIEVLVGLLASLERFFEMGILRAVHGCTAGLALGLVLLIAPGPAESLGALVVGEIATCLVGTVGLSRLRDRRIRAGRSERRAATVALLRVSLPALLAGIALQPALWGGQVLLSRHPDGLMAVGVFAVALRWHAIALFVPATMGSVLLPMLGRLNASGRAADARTLFLRYGGITLLFSTAAGLALLVLAQPLMGLQGAEFGNASTTLAVLGLAVVPTALNNVLSQQAVADGRIALWVWSDIALAATLVVAAFLLVPALGATGLAWAYLLAYTATCVVLVPVATLRRAGRP